MAPATFCYQRSGRLPSRAFPLLQFSDITPSQDSQAHTSSSLALTKTNGLDPSQTHLPANRGRHLPFKASHLPTLPTYLKATLKFLPAPLSPSNITFQTLAAQINHNCTIYKFMPHKVCQPLLRLLMPSAVLPASCPIAFSLLLFLTAANRPWLQQFPAI